jgi:tetratricopeptide (TPR) repeat protein
MERKCIQIRGRKEIENGVFKAEVVFPSPSENSYAVTVHDPFVKQEGKIEKDQEARLSWYFEEYLASPFTDKETKKRAEESIGFYGESLFNDLFKDTDALHEWKELARGLEKVQVQVYSDDPAFQALHWEALKDKKESKFFCLLGVEFVRTSGKKTVQRPIKESACLNVLMVTARPRGKDDVEYLTVTRPVVETVENKRMQVCVHLLRPPTFQALKNHLRDKKGFYHIVHFDVHGSVLPFDWYQELMKSPGETGVVRPALTGGRREVKPYEGTRAFISLVGEKGGVDLVLAEDMGELLKEAHVPVCFLNACQSAMATSDVTPGARQLVTEASLAMSFLEQDVRLVLGMAWSLTVSAARVLMQTLYDALTGGEEPGTALNRARQALFENRVRDVGGGWSIELEDWLLPVVWGKGDFSLKLKTASFEESAQALEQKEVQEKELEGMQTTGEYGFLGRDVDISHVESMLLKKNILLIRGMGGTGKTTLLGFMAQWWLKTGWIQHVFYFPYDQKPFRAEEILNAIAEDVMAPEDYGRFLVMPDTKKKAMVLADFLKESKQTPAVLLVLDNMESITGTEKAVGSRLEKKEQEILVQVLKRLMGSSIKILLGSRAPEEWLGKDTFKESVYILEGLDRKSRFALSQNILEKCSIDVEDWQGFNRLMEVLAGYPLAMEIILPNLAGQDPLELLEMLSGAGVDFSGGSISEAIFKCINISFSLLTEKAQSALLVFTPFTAFLNAMFLEDYLKELHAADAFTDLTLADLEEALAQAETQGLIKEEPFEQCYTLQPVLPFFLGQQAGSLEVSEKDALDRVFCTYMSVLAKEYNALMQSKSAEQKQVGNLLFKMDRENLDRALQWVLDEQGDFYPLYAVFNTFYFDKPLYREAIQWMEGIVGKLDLYADKEQDFLENYAYVVGNLATQYQEIKDYSKARINYKNALDLLLQAGKRNEAAAVYHQLGWVAQEERDFSAAKSHYREALKIKQEFNDRYSQASTYHQLGWVAQAERDFSAAKSHYREALKICQEFNDRYSQASTYHQLGRVAEEERDFSAAKSHYREALKICQEFNDRYSQAGTYHQLGRVAEEERDFSAAKSHYREALKIYQEFNDRYEQAGTYHQLGLVAEEERDFSAAKSHYREALKIKQEYNDRYSQASTYHQLGMVAEEERDFSAAKSHYREALKIFQEFNDRYSQASTYHQLGRVSAEEEDFEQALSHYALALEILTEYKDEYSLNVVKDNLARLFQSRDEAEVREEVEGLEGVGDETIAMLKEIINDKL